jgi:hypothetical protein
MQSPAGPIGCAPNVRTACICTRIAWVSSALQLLLYCELQLCWLFWGSCPRHSHPFARSLLCRSVASNLCIRVLQHERGFGLAEGQLS